MAVRDCTGRKVRCGDEIAWPAGGMFAGSALVLGTVEKIEEVEVYAGTFTSLWARTAADRLVEVTYKDFVRTSRRP